MVLPQTTHTYTYNARAREANEKPAKKAAHAAYKARNAGPNSRMICVQAGHMAAHAA